MAAELGPGGPGHARREPRPEQLETVHCPQALVGRLIGKQGDTIKDLQRRSGARIQIDQNFPEGTPRVVTVEGSAQCARSASSSAVLIGNSPAVGNGNPGKMTTFECPKALVGRVIGKGGETINELQRRSGARIQIEQRVQGSDAAVEEARRLTHDAMGASARALRRRRRLLRPGAPPGAGYGIPPYLVPQTGGVDFAGGLAQYSRAPRENEARRRRGSAASRAPPRAPTRADPQADGRAPSGGVLYPPPGAYGVPPYAYAYGGGAPYAYAPYYARGGLVPGAYGGPPPPPPAQAVTPDGWTSHVDGQGRQYWHHATSGQSSWDAPPSQSP
ncbi:hypothetical protein JL722_5729 [Aureococcus anophagefferens]|nr:hypothetical protein JL722_5729 [Aureococcus anophagefferens]